MATYQFYGRIKTLAIDTEKGEAEKYTCSFEVETLARLDKQEYKVISDGKIAAQEIPDSFNIAEPELFCFISAHSKERLRIEYNEPNKIIKAEVCNEY